MGTLTTLVIDAGLLPGANTTASHLLGWVLYWSAERSGEVAGGFRFRRIGVMLAYNALMMAGVRERYASRIADRWDPFPANRPLGLGYLT